MLKQKPNEKCQCGSGQKYKKCCSGKNIVKKFTCDTCGSMRNENNCEMCYDLYKISTTNSTDEVNELFNVYLYGKYAKTKHHFLRCYEKYRSRLNNIYGNPEKDNFLCTFCGATNDCKNGEDGYITRYCKKCKKPIY